MVCTWVNARGETYWGMTKLWLVCTWNAAQGVVLWYCVNGFKAPAPGAVLQQPWGIWSCDGQYGMGRYTVLCCWALKGLPAWCTYRDTSTTLLLLMPGIDSHYCQRCKGNLKKKKTNQLYVRMLQSGKAVMWAAGKGWVEANCSLPFHFGVRRQ